MVVEILSESGSVTAGQTGVEIYSETVPAGEYWYFEAIYGYLDDSTAQTPGFEVQISKNGEMIHNEDNFSGDNHVSKTIMIEQYLNEGIDVTVLCNTDADVGMGYLVDIRRVE